MTPLLDSLRAVVGPTHVLADADVVAPYEIDWTRRYRGSALAVVRPRTVDEVRAIVDLCRSSQTSIVPQGGNTGLVGGGIPQSGSIVVSTARMAAVRVDGEQGTAHAGAGTTIAALQAAAAASGWRYGVDFGARDTATVGGAIATNAGGLNVIRHGLTRAQLLGVEAVLGNGDVIRHDRALVKDNTGLDLASLLCGSEGTLGVITGATVRLVAPAGETVTVAVGCPDLDAAVALASAARRAVPTLEAAEFVMDDGVALVESRVSGAAVFDPPPPVFVILEAVGPPDPSDDLASVVAETDAGQVAVATDRASRARLWVARERITESISAVGVPHKLDVTLPLRALAQFCTEVRDVVANVHADARVWLFGHLGDGNVHVNVTGVDPDDHRVDDAVLGLVVASGGSISAEHGIGRAKRVWLAENRSPGDLAAMQAIKAALDPDGICNPGVLYP